MHFGFLKINSLIPVLIRVANLPGDFLGRVFDEFDHFRQMRLIELENRRRSSKRSDCFAVGVKNRRGKTPHIQIVFFVIKGKTVISDFLRNVETNKNEVNLC